MNAETIRLLFQSPFIYSEYSQKIVHDLFGCNYVYETLDSAERLNPSPDGDQNFFLGRMEDSERQLLGFFYTRVAEGSDVRRKRVGLWKLIQPYLKYEVEAAIAVFDDGQHWRLSYIYDHKKDKTSAKRFSYVLGDKQGQYKTPLERLDKVAAKAGRFKLDDLKEAFSVEALSKEFFDEYHRHYDRILRTTVELISKDPTLFSGLSKFFADYIKKMMGRIVFLHFLQKKGWLNGDPEFLKNLFFMQSHDRREDFLEQVLEPLFFGIFNTEPQNREKLFHDEGWDVQLLEQWKGLPYLNGGLFERDSMDKAKLKLPASLFERLFEFMASYNFTVDENDPDDADIGVDPEMLGKIFESLLEDNKAKGAFYTPKEIVRYMCKESLIAYLGTQATGQSKESGIQATGLSKESGEQASSLSKESGEQASSLSKESGVKATGLSKEPGEQASSLSKEPGVQSAGLSDYIRKFVEQHEFPEELEPYREVLDTALRKVKICDPAIGSGAFPMGLLNELWRCREALEERATSPSLMGIQANGLSQAGSLYSKEGQAGSLNPYSRAALKREIIENNIYGVDIEQGAIDIARLRFWLSIVVDAEKPEPLPNFDYKFMQGNSLIESFDGHDLSHIMDKDRGSRSIPGRSARKTGWAENQTGMEFGSDEVKQNLRNWLKMYFSLTDHKEKAYYRELINSSVKNYIVQQGIGPAAETRLNAIDPSANKDFFLWHTWFKEIFDNGGFDIVIGNPPYINVKNGIQDAIKQTYKENYKTAVGQFDLFTLFIEKGLALSNNGILTLIVPKPIINNENYIIARQLLLNKGLTNVITGSNIFENAGVESCIVIAKESTGYLVSEVDNNRTIINKYLIPVRVSLRLPFSMISTELNSEKLSIIEKIQNNKHVLLGKLVDVTRGIEGGKTDGCITLTPNKYKLIRGQDCVKYSIIPANLYCVYDYGNVTKFKPLDLYFNTKLLIRRVANELISTVDYDNYLCLNTIYCGRILDGNYKYTFVSAILNSSLMNYWFRNIFVLTDKLFPYIRKSQLDYIPIVVASIEQQQTIADLVDKILVIKKANPQADTSTLEYEIDQQVYALYNITPEEIAIIEQNN